ncbi:hypothetical protein D9758_010016 [Tetrapyrgos nigripes]|uniref:PPM-type phosphatase domain-containing protein n=1 Tax=Tetrapyrgos nigripes TaxID=182062 RepID=A0A8H5CVV2_9AGAR|nr:hypothetical protein D9758_010016 [Tetrapyrgos nigripes]
MNTPAPQQYYPQNSQVSSERVCGADTVAFQPRLDYNSEDRHFVQDWILPTGKWKFLGVFDGHGAGTEAVEFVTNTLPAKIQESISSNLDLATLTDDEIRQAIWDPDTNKSSVKVLRGRTGTTALLALVDPFEVIHIASLGDCQALICERPAEDLEWDVKLLTKQHNCMNQHEVDRVREEHPDEKECVKDYRTLGLITLTRALGDMPFKLPAIYTQRVFALATPPFHENYRFHEIIDRNRTPPYLSTAADIIHLRPSASTTKPILILASDGLADLYAKTGKGDITKALSSWLTKYTVKDETNAAVDLLFDVFGGFQENVRSKGRVDDITIVFLSL